MPSAQHTIEDELSTEDIERRLALLKQGVNPDEVVEEAPPSPGLLVPDDDGFFYYKPWVDAADEYITWAKSPELRVYTGITEFDDAMRGLAPAELMLVVGYAHSGKTVFTTQMLLHNHDSGCACLPRMRPGCWCS